MKQIILILSVIILNSCNKDSNFPIGAIEPDNEVANNLTISTELLDVNSNPHEKITIDIKSDTYWEITNIPTWCTFDKTEGYGNAIVNITIQRNDLSTERDQIIKINKKKLTVKQAGAAILEDGAIVGHLGDNSNLSLVKKHWYSPGIFTGGYWQIVGTYGINKENQKITYHKNNYGYYLLIDNFFTLNTSKKTNLKIEYEREDGEITFGYMYNHMHRIKRFIINDDTYQYSTHGNGQFYSIFKDGAQTISFYNYQASGYYLDNDLQIVFNH